ncbi:MAG: hypothetical protein OJF50_004667 [Nitrospira sp.]|jgi:hypothetical protein|nr:hypothetical protein [Nitrospira sp.]
MFAPLKNSCEELMTTTCDLNQQALCISYAMPIVRQAASCKHTKDAASTIHRPASTALFRYSALLAWLIKTRRLHRLIFREKRLSHKRAEVSVRGTLRKWRSSAGAVSRPTGEWEA